MEILAFYFGIGVDYSTRLAWLDSMLPFERKIGTQLWKNVVLGEWGANWVWLAIAMDWYVEGVRDAKSYSIYTARFFQVTYTPIYKALNKVF